MKWEDMKKEIKSITKEEMMYIELMADIVTARMERDMTQRDLAEATGLLQPAIARFEDPTKNANVMTMLKVLDALGYEIILKPKEK